MSEPPAPVSLTPAPPREELYGSKFNLYNTTSSVDEV
jgi:hypothetical protein